MNEDMQMTILIVSKKHDRLKTVNEINVMSYVIITVRLILGT